MADIIKVSAAEACKLIQECGEEVFCMFENDLEHNTAAIKSRVKKENVLMIIPEAKSIFANIDKSEDSFSVLSLYSSLQRNHFNIVRKGTKKDILLIERRMK